jgi:hypothetical protein
MKSPQFGMKCADMGMKCAKFGMKLRSGYETKLEAYEKNLSGTTRVNFMPPHVFHTYLVY